MVIERVETGTDRHGQASPRAARRYQVVAVAANTTRLWRPGETVYRGEYIGRTVYHGDPVHASAAGRIAGIEYDIDLDELILRIAPRSQRSCSGPPTECEN